METVGVPLTPIIVKDTTSFYWQIVLAGARKAGKDLGVKVPELGTQSDSDINGQISILENEYRNLMLADLVDQVRSRCLAQIGHASTRQRKF